LSNIKAGTELNLGQDVMVL